MYPYLAHPPLAERRVHGEGEHGRHRPDLRPRRRPPPPQRLPQRPLAHVVLALRVPDQVDGLACCTSIALHFHLKMFVLQLRLWLCMHTVPAVHDAYFT